MEQPRASFQFAPLDSRNLAYVQGKSDAIASDSDWSMVGAGVALATVIGMIFVLSALSLLGALVSGDNTNLGNRVIVTLFTGAGTAFLIYQIIDPLRTVAATRRLAREGRILHGEVTGVETRPMGRAYALRVSYRFTTPEGEVLTGITGVPPSAGTVILARGSTLAILYVNENLHRAL